MMRTRHLLPALTFLLMPLASLAQNTLYSYGIGNWRNGPVVVFSPLFETTEAFTATQIEEWIREQWPATFTPSTEMDVLFFATVEEAEEHRRTLRRKYAMRKLDVHLLEADTMPHTGAVPERPISAPSR